jgi:hypothetical protein
MPPAVSTSCAGIDQAAAVATVLAGTLGFGAVDETLAHAALDAPGHVEAGLGERAAGATSLVAVVVIAKAG